VGSSRTRAANSPLNLPGHPFSLSSTCSLSAIACSALRPCLAVNLFCYIITYEHKRPGAWPGIHKQASTGCYYVEGLLRGVVITQSNYPLEWSLWLSIAPMYQPLAGGGEVHSPRLSQSHSTAQNTPQHAKNAAWIISDTLRRHGGTTIEGGGGGAQAILLRGVATTQSGCYAEVLGTDLANGDPHVRNGTQNGHENGPTLAPQVPLLNAGCEWCNYAYDIVTPRSKGTTGQECGLDLTIKPVAAPTMRSAYYREV
ncbi:hypothetical protein FRC11_000164, partial [Ceratobasidium sp. 423]